MTTDLRTGIKREYRPSDYITKIAGTFTAKAGTSCPMWMKFLNTVLREDSDVIEFMQRFMGYCLTGYTIEQVLAFLYGPGGNGKGVFTKTGSEIMGDYAVVAPIELLISSRHERHPTEIAKLRGARLVVASETQAGRSWDEVKLKQLTGSDKLTGRFMRQDFFDFTPTHKFLILGNHMPSLRNVDDAMSHARSCRDPAPAAQHHRAKPR
jgi:putative DNA primase/helicase